MGLCFQNVTVKGSTLVCVCTSSSDTRHVGFPMAGSLATPASRHAVDLSSDMCLVEGSHPTGEGSILHDPLPAPHQLPLSPALWPTSCNFKVPTAPSELHGAQSPGSQFSHQTHGRVVRRTLKDMMSSLMMRTKGEVLWVLSPWSFCPCEHGAHHPPGV